MSALRVSPALLRLVAAANAATAPVAAHHATAYAARAHGHKFLTEGELWFIECVLRLSTLSEGQQARLNDIAVKVERGRE